jgi:hypothetical protein
LCLLLNQHLVDLLKPKIVAYENNEKRMESVYSKRIRAGKRRTYFFDVRATRSNDYYLTITESRKKFNEDGYDRHKIFLYKEDFNKFLKALTEAVDYVKTELMPDFDFDAYNHDSPGEGEGSVNEGPSEVRAVVSDPIDDIIDIDTPSVVSSTVPASTISSSTISSSTPNTSSGEEVDKW